jgi:indolepyruvate ferredoxin oxidoreductase beta subunit
MNELSPIAMEALLATDRPICMAILAMGGQGGGVLADWIVGLAESEGWYAQSTSVPGVAQRTGATIYYIELLAPPHPYLPTLSLMPTPGDVDIVLAAELMEGGRSMLRGLVTPDRTLLITSNHRSLAVGEKMSPGDGAGDPNLVTQAAGIAAKRVISFDMERMATEAKSVISATMFGALAGSGALPFSRAAFERAIGASQRSVDASLRAFALGYESAAGTNRGEAPRKTPAKSFSILAENTGHPELDAIVRQINTAFPPTLRPMLMEGARRLVDFQDAAYAVAYLRRVAPFCGLSEALGLAAAKYVALAMAYDDVIRVADLKTRAARFARVRAEMRAAPGQILRTTEFMHPRGEEVLGLLPVGLARWLLARPTLFRVLDKLVNRPRRVKTGTIHWFAILYGVAGLRVVRRKMYRYAQEMAAIDDWLALAGRTLAKNESLAVEILATRRLVKGYSDTHVRGAGKFARVLSAVPLLEHRADGGDWLRRLREAALAEESSAMLEGALRTVASLEATPA